MVEMLAVGLVDRLPVLQALEHNERRVQERHGQQDQRQHERHHGRCLYGGLHGDDAHQQPEQLRAAVAHEAGRGREVIKQKAERGAGGQGCKHSRLLAAEVERDHGHGSGDDRAHARGKTVNAVGEVDDVHHHHQSDYGQHRAGVGRTGVGKGKGAGERQRDRLDGDTEVDHDHGRQHLAEQLDGWVQLEAVIQRTDERDHCCSEQHPMPQLTLVFASVAAGQPHQAGD